MTLQIRSNPNQLPTDHEMAVYSVMAKQAVASKMYRGIGDENGVMMIMLAAREMGLPTMACLNGGLNIINGKVEISARMMSAMIRRAGHSIKIEQSTDDVCVLSGRRCDNGDTARASFSVAEAQKAGIFKAGGGWTKWPKDMCFARALSRLCRQLFSDVIGTGYIEGEIGERDTKPALESDPVEISVNPITNDYYMAYMDLFAESDKVLAQDYLLVVMRHFDWDQTQALNNLLEDRSKLMEKFNAWKVKNAAKTDQDNG